MTDKELLKEIEALAEYRKTFHKDSPTLARDVEALEVVAGILKSKEATEEEEKITPDELAEAFDMKVAGVAKSIGYSRSGFVYSFSRKAKLSRSRIDCIAKMLRTVSEEKYIEDVREAERKKVVRENAVRRFVKSYGGGAIWKD